MVDGSPPTLDFFAAEHEDVLRNEEVRKCVIQPIHFDEPTPVRSERLPFDDEQVDIRVRSRVAPCVRPEEDDLVRIDLVHDRSHHLFEERRVDRHGPSSVRFRHGCRSVSGGLVGQRAPRAARRSGGLRFGESRTRISVGPRRGRRHGRRTAHRSGRVTHEVGEHGRTSGRREAGLRGDGGESLALGRPAPPKCERQQLGRGRGGMVVADSGRVVASVRRGAIRSRWFVAEHR